MIPGLELRSHASGVAKKKIKTLKISFSVLILQWQLQAETWADVKVIAPL